MPAASFAETSAMGKPVAFDARADERDVRGLISMMTTRPVFGSCANWTFVLWGAYHGLLLAVERMLGKRGLAWALPRPVQIFFTFVLVMFGWVFFRAPTLAGAGRMFAGLAGLNGWGAAWPLAGTGALNWGMLVLALGLALAARNTWEIRWRPSGWLAAALLALFALCVATFLVNTSSPFLYFQF